MLDQTVSVSSRLNALKSRFDIFKLTSEGHLIWIETAETLSGAITRACALCEKSPDVHCMVFRQDTKQKIFVSTNEPIRSET